MPRGSRRLLLVAIGLTLTMTVAACGSGGGSETSTVAAIPKAKFMKEVLAICAQANDEIGRVYNRYTQPPYPGGKRPTSEDMNRVAEEVVIPARAKQIRRMRALGAPRGEEEKIKAIIEAIEEGIQSGERDRRTLRADGTEYAFAKALELEIAYGIEECAVG
jgi:hypothetical protein